MKEVRLGRWYDERTETDWQVVEWGEPGRVKNIDENRLTYNGINDSDYTTFAIVYPDGTVVYRSWSGALPDDLDDLVDYWMQHGSL